MYTDENRKRSLIVDFILKLILIIIFVLLLIWLVPWPNMDSLNPLKDQIFNANLQTMKEAGITYFTTERLPVEVGDKTTLTLQKMLDMKLLVPFTDKNGDSCDVNASYVSLEKMETEYLMTVNLKCGEEEDYIQVHLGCYSYCTSDICEKDPTSNEESTTTPTTKPSTSPSTSPTTKPTTSPTMKPTTSPTTKPTTSPTVTPSVEKEYEYSKTVEATYSNWSEWTKYVYTDDVVFEKTETREVEDLGTERIQVGTIGAVYENIYFEKYQMVKYKTLTFKLCNKYSYVADVNTVYRVLSDWEYTNDYARGYRDDIPYDTLDTRWVLQGVDYNECKEECVSNPYGIYRKQTRQIAVDSEYSNVTASCDDVVEKSVDVYMSVPVGWYQQVLKTPEQKLYGDVRYYRVRTRTLLSKETTVYKWSSYNDTTLLNNGYTYTGKSRNK